MFADAWSEAAFYLVMLWIVIPSLVARSLLKKVKEHGVLDKVKEECVKQDVAGKVVKAALGKWFK
ncbi:MAG TPA: hypothetical protein VNK04_05835 [Gemmataceae bacterium]|nr:hypothetical protein [Gemmataceae bacterium]